MNASDILTQLTQTLVERRDASPDESYVARLHAGGAAAIGKKVGEEAAEVIIAGLDDQPEALVHEVADLWFHTMVLLNHHGLDATAVLAELQRRFGVSGLDEKAARAAEGK
ncbi:phosphoribosyl-ATP diphosphatase [uncultured Abyssibacter sp.]|uniref:phosphoribosyl-ATP diphosphatase n=1 Tax=uncultured Abyssibacter sp. TaxID=2320202 RepID=UPI0032B0F17B